MNDSARAHADPRARLHDVLEHAAHLLPAQGPIGVFVHHNTLHAFQHLPFEHAVVQAAEIFGAEPFLPEARYRDELARGRIEQADLDAVIEAELRARGGDRDLFGGRLTRAELWHRVLACGIDEDGGSSLRWRIDELGLLRRLREDIPSASARAVVSKTSAWLRPMIDRGDLAELADVLVGERALDRAHERLVRQIFIPLTLPTINDALLRAPQGLAVCALWTACRRRVLDRREEWPRPTTVLRHRDLLLRATGVDTDTLVDPVLIRLTAAFLDQGVAYWPMPDRELGMLGAVRKLMLQVGAVPSPWLRPLRQLLRTHARRELGADDVVLDMLDRLGVAPDHWQGYLERVLLALPGWAGLVHRLEHEPELAPHEAPPCALVDFLAVRLVYEYLAVRWVAREQLDHEGPLGELERRLAAQVEPARAAARDHAYRLFQVCQLGGIAAPDVLALSDEEIAEGLAELDAFSQIERRRLWHLAYERRHRQKVTSAVVQHRASIDASWRPESPQVQYMFCIDEREESIRRAVEEQGPQYETFGTAGFFGFAMYYWGVDDAHAAALCPIVVRPEHRVLEVPVAQDESTARGRRVRRRLWSKLARYTFVSSRSLVRGWIATVGLGLFSLAPLLMRVLFPRFSATLRARLRDAWFPQPRTRLTMVREAEARGEISVAVGFDLDEKVGRVARVLEDAGFTQGFAPLVVVLGHGSTSLNNPHESAHDCGACGGRRGGPNARLFAHMINQPEVRTALRARGIDIPAETWFVGGYHDTCNDSVVLYDLEDVPPTLGGRLVEARRVIDRARMMSAHERCRRFEAIDPTAPPEIALRHVEARAEHLAEPRPEYGHCTNAICVFGRRALTRGLFFDRRAFLVSYDPTTDGDGEILARLLAAMGPVGAGINLEYYFSYVDNERYGCGTKLPHNVTGLVGVMNGHSSDLRTGLPWQMVEIHEPVRMLTIVESKPETLLAIAQRVPPVGELVINRWIQLVTIDPDDGSAHVFEDGAFVPFVPERTPLPEVYASAHWYTGQIEHLDVARVRAAMIEPAGTQVRR